jgi:hypothetical protein
VKRWGLERLAAYSGVVFVAMFVLGFLVGGNPPDLTASKERWTLWFAANHRRELAAAILIGVALVAFVWFLGSLWSALRGAGQPRLAAVALASGLAAAGLGYVWVAVWASAYRVGIDQQSLLKGMVDFGDTAVTVIGFPLAGLAASTAIASARAGFLPRWYAPAGGLTALVLLFGGGALAQHGFYRPDGPYAFLALAVFLVWTAVTSVLIAGAIPAEAAGSTLEAHP